MGKVAKYVIIEKPKKSVMSLQQFVFLTHKYLNPIIKSSNFRIRIIKYRYKESD